MHLNIAITIYKYYPYFDDYNSTDVNIFFAILINNGSFSSHCHYVIFSVRFQVACTYYSKWPEAQALPSKCAEGIAKFIYSLTARFGCFRICISDQGRNFVNSLNEKLFLLTGTEHRIASAYHPQTNGLDERLNQTVTKSLVKYINADQNDWDENLESVLVSYHTSVDATTKYTPFFLMYGREAVLPIQLQTGNVDNDHTLVTITDIESEAQKYATQLDMTRTEAFMKVASNIQTKQKLYYDCKHSQAEFQLGNQVLLRNMRKLSQKGGKMDKEWTGTFTIAEVCGKGLYSLKNAHGKVLKKKYNSIQLKIYEERQGHAAASDEDIESKIELDGTNSHNEEKRDQM